MTQPIAQQSLALFRDRLLVKFVFLPANNVAANFSSDLKPARLRA